MKNVIIYCIVGIAALFAIIGNACRIIGILGCKHRQDFVCTSETCLNSGYCHKWVYIPTKKEIQECKNILERMENDEKA